VVCGALKCVLALIPRGLPSLQRLSRYGRSLLARCQLLSCRPLADELFRLLATYAGFATGESGAGDDDVEAGDDDDVVLLQARA